MQSKTIVKILKIIRCRHFLNRGSIPYKVSTYHICVGISQACILKGSLVVMYEFKGYKKRNIIMTKFQSVLIQTTIHLRFVS